LLMGIVATYSFANGFGYWPIGLLILALASPGNRRIKKLAVVLWIVAGLIVFGSYLYDYHSPPHHLSAWANPGQPVEYILYVFKYLGSPIVYFSYRGALLAGLLGLVLFGYEGFLFARFRPIEASLLVPYVCLALYSIGSALITGIGRAGFGSGQAMSSRYVTFSYLLWVSIVVFLHLLSRANNSSGLRCHQKRLRFIMVAIAFSLIVSSAYGTWRAIGRHNQLLPARETLVAVSSERDYDLIKRLYIHTDTVEKGLAILKECHLSMYRH